MANLRRSFSAASGRLLQLAGLLLGAVTVARVVYYPFWAAGATQQELARSWGGPGALGATLAHWAVGMLTIAVAALLFVLGGRLRFRSRR
jgi:hypothetical protein